MTRSTRSIFLALLLTTATVASANAQLLKAPIHLHPNADGRVSFRVKNDSPAFREVTIDDKTYEVGGHQQIVVKAPVGTVIYAGYGITNHVKGSILVEVKPELDGKTINVS